MQTTKLRLQIFKKNVKSKLYHIEKFKSVDLDEEAHFEQPH